MTYTISDLASNEWLNHSMYTISSRAIPSMVDGLKVSQRFYLRSSILLTPKQFDKVAAIAGNIAKLGYSHGEESAAEAGVKMAQTFNNNFCLVEGRGGFGSRLIPQAAASRYIYTRLNPDFNKMVTDIDLLPPHPDPEVDLPLYYAPTIPIILANGASGIATGFATNIFPRAIKDLKAACLEYVTTGKVKNQLLPSFPEFKGTVESLGGRSYIMKGTYQRHSKTKLTITEVPISYTRETYIQHLDSLEEEQQIVSYEDKCGPQGFEFDITLKRSDNLSDDAVMRMFKLTSKMTENITVLDPEGKLKIYEAPKDLVVDFCEHRLSFMQTRIDARKKESLEVVRWLNIKVAFIRLFLDDKLVFKGKKKVDIISQIVSLIDGCTQTDADNLLKLNFTSLTQEQVDDLLNQVKSAEEQSAYWAGTTPSDQFKSDLKKWV